MKLTYIEIDHFLGASRVSVVLDKPVNLFAGHNAAGKSSVQEAVRMALTGETVRVSLKKDFRALLTDGATAGFIDIGTDTGAAVITLPGGKRNDFTTPAALPYVLDAQRFSHMEANERRSFLFGLMGVKITPDAVAARLKKRGCEMDKAQRVTPLLRAGFDAAHKEARSKATEAKGAWRAVTGETYGSVKAASWSASVPEHDDTMPTLETELKHADTALEAWQQSIGKLTAEAERRAAMQSKLPALQEHAGRVSRISSKLVTDTQQLAQWEADLTKTAAAAGAGPRVGMVHDLANALNSALFFVSPKHEFIATMKGPLDAYEAEFGKLDGAGDTKAADRLPSVRNSRDLMASAVANDKRDLEAAKQAHADMEAINAALAKPFDDSGLAEARQQAEAIKAQRAAVTARMNAERALKAQASAAEKKTTDAAKHHADVAAWDLIGDALAPDGIPGEMLAEALEPINERLARSAADAEWLRVGINADMSITYGLRPYALLSESERWRADAMVAEAVSHLSGLKLLVLDRFDVLDLQGRSDLLLWLDILATDCEIDCALIFGTLKQLPGQLPDNVAAHWLAGGVLLDEQPAKQAA